MNKMTLQTKGDRYIVVTRRFAAPPQAVYVHIQSRNLFRNGCSARLGGQCPFVSARRDQTEKYVTSGPMTKVVHSTLRASIWNCSLTAGSFMWSACTYPTPLPTTR